jgi:hypothetical protein
MPSLGLVKTMVIEDGRLERGSEGSLQGCLCNRCQKRPISFQGWLACTFHCMERPFENTPYSLTKQNRWLLLLLKMVSFSLFTTISEILQSGIFL